MTIIQNKIIHRFIRDIAEYEENGEFYNQVIPADTQAYAIYTKTEESNKEGLFYVFGDGAHTYTEIRDGKGGVSSAKEFPVFTSEQLDTINNIEIASDIDEKLALKQDIANMVQTFAENESSEDKYPSCSAVSSLVSPLTSHVSDKNNPHEVTKTQVGLDQVDNTSDLDKPLSTAVITKFEQVETAINIETQRAQNAEDVLNTAIAGKANKATTLSGYGITDAYTKTEVDTALSGKMDNTSLSDYATQDSVNALATQLSDKANKATTLAGYNISDAYTKDATDYNFAGLSKDNRFSGDNTFDGKTLITRKAGSSTPVEFKVESGIAKFYGTNIALEQGSSIQNADGDIIFTVINAPSTGNVEQVSMKDEKALVRGDQEVRLTSASPVVIERIVTDGTGNKLYTNIDSGNIDTYIPDTSNYVKLNTANTFTGNNAFNGTTSLKNTEIIGNNFKLSNYSNAIFNNSSIKLENNSSIRSADNNNRILLAVEKDDNNKEILTLSDDRARVIGNSEVRLVSNEPIVIERNIPATGGHIDYVNIDSGNISDYMTSSTAVENLTNQVQENTTKLASCVTSTDVTKMVKITQAAYDALATKDPQTFYIIVEE